MRYILIVALGKRNSGLFYLVNIFLYDFFMWSKELWSRVHSLKDIFTNYLRKRLYVAHISIICKLDIVLDNLMSLDMTRVSISLEFFGYCSGFVASFHVGQMHSERNLFYFNFLYILP